MKKRSKSSSIYFLVPYPIGFAPSQRFRFEQYFQILQQRGYKIKHQSFLAETHWKLFNTKGQLFTKSFVIIVGLVKRLVALVQIQSFTFVFIHREAAPIGPPFFEWIIAKIFRKKIIYDFDDAIWLTDRKNESLSTQFIRWRNKVSSICKWSCTVSCGNAYLADYARQYNSNIVINPTTIDAVQLHNPDNLNIKKNPDRLVIGWTGSHSTLKYLDGLMNCMRLLQDKYSHLHFIVIGDKAPDLNLQRIEFIPWQKESEPEDLAQIDIGVMPLPDDEWTKGKCGFKALQYMAMKIPCVVSPVGVNNIIINHGENGFLASTETEWINYLEKLITDAELRKKFGESGRKKIVEHYSVLSNTSNFLSLFE